MRWLYCVWIIVLLASPASAATFRVTEAEAIKSEDTYQLPGFDPALGEVFAIRGRVAASLTTTLSYSWSGIGSTFYQYSLFVPGNYIEIAESYSPWLSSTDGFANIFCEGPCTGVVTATSKVDDAFKLKGRDLQKIGDLSVPTLFTLYWDEDDYWDFGRSKPQIDWSYASTLDLEITYKYRPTPVPLSATAPLLMFAVGSLGALAGTRTLARRTRGNARPSPGAP